MEISKKYRVSLKPGKLKGSTDQALRDYEKIQSRLAQKGLMVDIVMAYFEKIMGRKVRAAFILNVAQILSSMLQIKLDRLAKRNRTALLCWYAENWQKIAPQLQTVVLQYAKDPDFFTFEENHTFMGIEQLLPKKDFQNEKARNITNPDYKIDVSNIELLINKHD